MERIAVANALDGMVNLWDLSTPPPAFADWAAAFAGSDAPVVLSHAADLSGIGRPGFAEDLAAQVRDAARRGAAGLKVWKDLGLGLRDVSGQLVAVDDPRLDPMWAAAGECELPISIHVADPVAFFAPLDEHNERRAELEAHPDWWFGAPWLPSFDELLAQFDRVIGRHPDTTFIGVHVGCHAEDLGHVAEMLERHPNYLVDTSARLAEIGRQDPDAVRRFFIRFADRILFGTDLARTPVLTLPEHDGRDPALCGFYAQHWRYFETAEPGLPHPFPLQGDWTIHGIDLPEDVLTRIYYDNARRVFAALREVA